MEKYGVDRKSQSDEMEKIALQKKQKEKKKDGKNQEEKKSSHS